MTEPTVFSSTQIQFPDGKSVRAAARAGVLTGPTAGLAPGYVHANLVILPREHAFDFLLFCHRNPQPCPLLGVTDPGNPEPTELAPASDLRVDLPAYRVYRHGELADEPADLLRYWRDDLVCFLLGCSFTFEAALVAAGLPVRHIELGCNVPMYRTNIACKAAGVLHGNLVVSMRPMTPQQAIQAAIITSRFPRAHGAPIHWGDPSFLGIDALDKPDYGDPVYVRPGEVPVFWACGVTPQSVALSSKPPLLISHKPGHMFVTDLRDSNLCNG